MSTLDTSAIKEYTSWYRALHKELRAYEQWLHTYGDIQDSWHDEEPNKRLKSFVKTSHMPFSAIYTGITAAGKSYAINQVLKQYAKLADEDDCPILDKTIEHFPALQPNGESAQQHVNMEQVRPPCESLVLQTGIGSNSMVPVILMYQENTEPSCYFLKTESDTSEYSFDELTSICQDLTKPLSKYWQMTLCTSAQEIEQAIGLVNRKQMVTSSTAREFGFNTELLPVTENDTVEIPAWRLVVMNMPHPLLQDGVSIIDTPALDNLYYREDDMQSLIAGSSVMMHVLNTKSGLTSTDAQLFHKTSHLQNLQKQIVIHTINSHVTNIVHLAKVSTKQIVRNANEIIAQLDTTIDKTRSQMKQSLLTPLIRQMIVQSNVLKQNIETYESVHETNLQHNESLKREIVHLHDSVKKYQKKTDTIRGILDNSDVESLFKHISELLNAESLQRYFERAKSLYQSSLESDAAKLASLENARNIMLSGLKLDLRRVSGLITQINNSMAALYSDLGDNFQEDTIDLSMLTTHMDALETSKLILTESVEKSFETSIAKPLQDAYMNQIRLLSKWYQKHDQHVKAPLALYVAEMEKEKTEFKVKEESFLQHMKNMGDMKNAAGLSHTALKELFTITQQINTLLNHSKK